MSIKVLVCPAAYKGTLKPSQVGEAIARGIAQAAVPIKEVVVLPLADGGDGTVEALSGGWGGLVHEIAVTGPVGGRAHAQWLEKDNLAVVELASACGIAYLAEDRLAPLTANTYGLGEVMRHCLTLGFKKLVVTVGGSASTDGGTGALAALGACFFSAAGSALPLGGGALDDLARLDLSQLPALLAGAEIEVATDVTTPLLGPSGCARVFAPQKGAGAAEINLLEHALLRLADLLEAATGRHVRDVPGAGAAGGTAFGLACALGARIIPGFAWVSELTRLEEKIGSADLVITAEGKLDRQSLSGKVAGELASLCARHGKPLWAFPAHAEPGVDWQELGMDAVVPVCGDGGLATADDIARAVATRVASLPAKS